MCDDDDEDSDDKIGTTKILMLFAEAEACFSNNIGLLIKTYIRNDLVEDWCCAGYQNKEITAPDVTSDTH